MNTLITNNKMTYLITDRLILNELYKKSKLEKDTPMIIAVKENWQYAVIIIDNQYKNYPNFNFWIDNDFDYNQHNYDRYIISWIHVELALNNNNYDMIKLLCSRMSNDFLRNDINNLSDTQKKSINSIIKTIIKNFDIELIEYFSSLGLPIINEINNYTLDIAMMNDIKALDFYSVTFSNNDFLESLLYGCDNTIKWMEEHQPDICFVSNPNMFFTYPYGQNLFELVDNNNVEGVKYYFKYLGDYIHSIIVRRLLERCDKEKQSEMIEFLTFERLFKFHL